MRSLSRAIARQMILSLKIKPSLYYLRQGESLWVSPYLVSYTGFRLIRLLIPLVAKI